MKAQLVLVTIFNAALFFTWSEIQKYYKNEPKFHGVYSRNNLLKIKNGAYTINLNKFKSMGTRRIALYLNHNNATYFDSVGAEHIPSGKKNYRKQKHHNKYL